MASTVTYCEVCSLELQSAVALAEHCNGRKHLRKLWRANRAGSAEVCNPKRPPSFQHVRESLAEDDLFERLAAGRFRNIIVCTGAGVSTSAGIPDFRSTGGLFAALRSRFGERFPSAMTEPESLLSRSFATKHPDVWRNEIEPCVRDWKRDDGAEVLPTLTHRFCMWLHERGWLKRVYTQNIDGLHSHPSLLTRECAAGFAERVVEVHGSIRDASIVMYGDPLPSRFATAVHADFVQGAQPGGGEVDLMLVMGSALQVAPFCAIPNLAPAGATRQGDARPDQPQAR